MGSTPPLAVPACQLHKVLRKRSLPLRLEGRHRIHLSAGPIHLRELGELLFVGHMHRKWTFPGPTVPKGKLNISLALPDPAFYGSHYTEVFLTLSDVPPFSLRRLSHEWCLPATGVPLDERGTSAEGECDLIQFVSGLELARAPSALRARGADAGCPEPMTGHEDGAPRANQSSPVLRLSYGVNDCSAMVGEMPLRVALEMLRPWKEWESTLHPIESTINSRR
jgi:hypothetical protein